MSGLFGFSTEGGSGGDFLPIVKYDARAGRFFRIDRVDNGGAFESIPTDITPGFKAVFDLENIETGWIDFVAGGAPTFILVRLADLDAGKVAFPAKPPQPQAKPGVRFMIKLPGELAEGKPIREVASTAKAFVGAVEEVYKAYLEGRGDNPGKLPVVMLEGQPLPIKSGTGAQSSTNYRPKLRIAGWAPRGDLVHTPRGAASPPAAHTNGGSSVAAPKQNGAPPQTGGTRAPAPKAKAEIDLSDFG